MSFPKSSPRFGFSIISSRPLLSLPGRFHGLGAVHTKAVAGVFAYIGPGTGLELLGYSLSLILWMTAAMTAVVLYPVYSLLHWIRGGKKKPESPAEVGSKPGGEDAGDNVCP